MNKSQIRFGLLLIIVSLGSYLIFLSSQKVRPTNGTNLSHPSTEEPNYTSETEIIGKRFLFESERRKDLISSVNYVNELLLAAPMYDLYNRTIAYFQNSDGGFAAARFAIVSATFETSRAKALAMSWIDADIKYHSKELWQILRDKKDFHNQPIFLQNRILNLVHRMDIPNPDKLEFYGRTIVQPLAFNPAGQLDDKSNLLEVALFLSKQIPQGSETMARTILKAIAVNQERNQINALEARVTNYYPSLAFVFKEYSRNE